MVRMFPRFPWSALAAAAALVAFASPLAAAATFILPGDAVVEVRTFSFPSGTGASPERDPAAEFHGLLLQAMRGSGLTVSDDVARATETAPLVVTSLPADPLDAARSHDNGTADPDFSEADPQEGDGPDGEGSAEAPSAEPDETAPGPAPPAPRPVTHILEGHVSLYRETVGAPARIGGAIRIRTEALLHGTYTIRDAATGKVLISDASSASSARLVSASRDLDAALAELGYKAMASAAGKIASRLSGVAPPGEANPGDGSYYQDSPGKRLKPRK